MLHVRTIAKCLKPIGISILLAGIALGSASANNSRPEIDDIMVISSPTIDSNGDGRADAYGLGSTIKIAVTFNREVAWDISAENARGVKAAIKLDLYVGGQQRRISMVASSDRGTGNTLQFHYVVQEGDVDTDGITIKPFGRDLLLLTRGAKLRGSNGRNALRWCRWCNQSVNLGGLVLTPVQTAEPEQERSFSTDSETPVVQDPPRTARSTIQGTSDPSGLPSLTVTNWSTATKRTQYTDDNRKGTTWTWYEYTNPLQEVLRDGDAGHVNQVLNMNWLGDWSHPFYHDGSRANNGPDIEVRFRQTGAETTTFPAKFVFDDGLAAAAITVVDRWLTYPANPGATDIRIHVRTKTAAREDKPTMINIAKVYGEGTLWAYDYFIAEAHLVAPGTAVQPTAIAGQTSATWAGKVVAVDSSSNIARRGSLYGGDASVTVNFAATTADVTLNNFRSVIRAEGVVFPALTWSGLTVSNGAFSEKTASREISGAFRQQGSAGNANTVGGVFDLFGSAEANKWKGGFVATRN